MTECLVRSELVSAVLIVLLANTFIWFVQTFVTIGNSIQFVSPALKLMLIFIELSRSTVIIHWKVPFWISKNLLDYHRLWQPCWLALFFVNFWATDFNSTCIEVVQCSSIHISSPCENSSMKAKQIKRFINIFSSWAQLDPRSDKTRIAT
jgi:hypothetical protein